MKSHLDEINRTGRRTGTNDAINVIANGNPVVYGKHVSTLDYNRSEIVQSIVDELLEITFRVGNKTKNIVNFDLTDIRLDKDPKPGETARKRDLRGWVYLNTDYCNIINPTDVETRTLVKREIISAVREGVRKYNEKYNDKFIINSCEPITEKFRYKDKAIYIYFTLEEEAYKGEEKKKFIVVKKQKENFMEEQKIFDNILKETKNLKESDSYDLHNELVNILDKFSEELSEEEAVTLITDAFSNSVINVDICKKVGEILVDFI